MKSSSFLVGIVILLVFAAVLFTSRNARLGVPVDNLTDDTQAITEAAFQRTVAQTDRAVLVKFGAPWCGPCRQLDGELPTVAQQLGGDIEILKINVDNNREIAADHQVSSIPKMVLYRGGQPISTRIGYLNAEELIRWIDNTK